MIDCSARDDSLIFTVRVVPRAAKSEIVGTYGGALKIRLAAPPVDGAANVELIKLLAHVFAVAQNSVEIVSGASSRTKRVKISGADIEKLRRFFLR